MSREADARAAVQALIPDDEITDVAVTYPRGYTRAQGLGSLVGGAALGSGSSFLRGRPSPGHRGGRELFANPKDMPASIVLAVSPTAVYAIGRPSTALVGGWDHLVPMVKLDRSALRLEVRRTPLTREITLTDTEYDVSLELEVKLLGGLGANEPIDWLLLSESDDEGNEAEGKHEGGRPA